MKRKKRFAAALAAALMLSLLTGCSGGAVSAAGMSSAAPAPASAEAAVYNVGVLQQMEHTSLDEISQAITARFAEIAEEEGVTIHVTVKNAQGDATVMKSITDGFIADGMDVIVPIATGAAQTAAGATQEVPIVFSAVADPVAAGFCEQLDAAPTGNVTGVSNGIDVDKIFDLAQELTPGIKTYGFLYSTGEVNSQAIVAKAKASLDARGIGYEEVTVTSSGEVQAGVKALLEKDIDAVFVPNDNTVASAMSVLADETRAAGMPVYTAVDSLVRDGGLATVGISYTMLGRQTAEMAYRVLGGTPIGEIPIEVVSESVPVVNEETAAVLGVDASKIKA